jgi:hypothetical protein|nr:MAG TPA: hypothetical protein [Caudoviricetes sp.]
MTKQEMIAKLKSGIAGVGIKITYWNHDVDYTFYQDIEGSKGIDRASEQFAVLISKDKVRRAEFIYKEDLKA